MNLTAEEIEVELNGRKMFYVLMEREDYAYVIANDEKEAKKIAIERKNEELNSEDYYNDCNASVRQEISYDNVIFNGLGNSLPFSKEEYELNFSVMDYINYLKEKERKNKIAEELDKKQLKFEFYENN